jgi:hypothetical protein
MKHALARVAALTALAALPLSAQDAAPQAPLSLEQRTGLRCAAAFALLAQAQARGDAEALSLPPLAQRGREFFVRFSAQLMDDRGLTRESVAELLGEEVQALGVGSTLAQVTPACLVLLDASGL